MRRGMSDSERIYIVIFKCYPFNPLYFFCNRQYLHFTRCLFTYDCFPVGYRHTTDVTPTKIPIRTQIKYIAHNDHTHIVHVAFHQIYLIPTHYSKSSLTHCVGAGVTLLVCARRESPTTTPFPSTNMVSGGLGNPGPHSGPRWAGRPSASGSRVGGLPCRKIGTEGMRD
jgi:hypothetical protein